MFSKSTKSSKIFKEMNEEQHANFFDFREGKFLHEIDTFYYSVKLNDDFTSDGCSMNVSYFRDYWIKELDNLQMFSYKKCTFDNLNVDGLKGYVPDKLPTYFILSRSGFASMYNIHLSRPDFYDIFIAPIVPNADTSQILVQIRSYYLWLHGVDSAFSDSFKDVKLICDLFGFEISEVIENRCDYAWHTNYIQSPDKFFKLENVARMRVSTLSEGDQHFKFRGNEDIELDYLRLGRLKSNNLILRIYLKSKEVVEQGYKGFFFKIWLIHGLINRYDVYVYEECYKKHSWEYLHYARLKFYVEYGSDETLRHKCICILDGVLKLDYDDLKKFADFLTPSPTLVLNVEYQTMRKFSKTLKLLPFRPWQGCCRRIYHYFDNRRLIIDYLTHSIFRLVDYNPEKDTNKSRCDYIKFWKRLRSTKLVDCHVVPKNLNVVRDYSTNLDKLKVKKAAMGSIVTYQLYDKGINEDKLADDVIDFLSTLNDNDIEYMKRTKDNKIQQLRSRLGDKTADYNMSDYKLINMRTGEIIN